MALQVTTYARLSDRVINTPTFAFASGAPAGPVDFVSTIKLRKAGFDAAVDTRDSFCGALQSFIDRNLLPPGRK